MVGVGEELLPMEELLVLPHKDTATKQTVLLMLSVTGTQEISTIKSVRHTKALSWLQIIHALRNKLRAIELFFKSLSPFFMPRDTIKYQLLRGNKVVYIGITNDFERRFKEHSKDKNFTSMQKVGNKVTRESARQWEIESLETYRRNHNGNNPEYNISNLGRL